MEQHRLLKQIAALYDKLADVNAEIRELLTNVSATSTDARSINTDVLKQLWERFLKEKKRLDHAERGALKIKMQPLPDGRLVVIVDEFQLKLPPRVGELVRALADPNGESPDGFIPFKTREELREVLGPAPGDSISDQSLSQLLSRVRLELDNHDDLHRKLLERDRLGRLRFRVRKPLVPVAPAAEPVPATA